MRSAFCLPYRVVQIACIWRVGLLADELVGNTPQSPSNGLEHVRGIQARQGSVARIARGLLNTVQTALRVRQAPWVYQKPEVLTGERVGGLYRAAARLFAT